MDTENTIKTSLVKKLELTYKFFRDLAFIIPIFLIFINLITVLFEKKIVIQPFHVSQKLIEEGYDGEIVAAKVLLRLETVRKEGNSYWNKDFVAHEIDISKEVIELPKSSFEQVVNYFTSKFDRNIYIRGRVSKNDTYNVVLEIDGKRSEIIGGQFEEIIEGVSIGILQRVDPLSLMAYLLSKTDLRLKEIAYTIINDTDQKSNKGFALHYLGSIYLSTSDFEKSRRFLKAALQEINKEKDQPPTLNNLGVSFFEEYRLNDKEFLKDSATKYYDKALKIDSSYYRSYGNMGNIYRTIEQPDEAIRLYSKALEYNPENQIIIAQLASIYFEKKDTLKAKDLIFKLSDIRPIDLRSLALVTILEYKMYNDTLRTNIYLDSLRKLDRSNGKRLYINTRKSLK